MSRNKRKGAGRKPVKRTVAVLADQGQVTRGECDHSHCKPVRITATQLVLADCDNPDSGVTRRQAGLALRHLPKLLCTPGVWPPQGVSRQTALLVYASFVSACVFHKAEGLRGQELAAYAPTAALLRATMQAEKTAAQEPTNTEK